MLNNWILNHCHWMKYRIRFLGASGHQSIHNLASCEVYYSPYSPYLIETVDWHWTSSQKHYNSSEWSLSKHNAHHSRLVLKNARRHFRATLNDHFEQRNHHKKHKNAKSMALSRPSKGSLYTTWELKQEVRVTPYLISAYNMCVQWYKVFTPLCWSVNDCEHTTSIDLGVKIHFSDWANLQV